MEDSAQNRKRQGWYVLFGLVAFVIFGVSIFAGYQLGGDKSVTPAEVSQETNISKYDPPLVTPTIGTPKPVTIEIVSELEGIALVDEIDAAVLAEWWKIIGVDSQALPLKELGSYNWYTPTRLRIVFRDIAPLSKDERWKLYKPTAPSREAEPISGLATEYDAAQPDLLEYHAYHDAQVMTSDKAKEAIERSVNRRVFEVLYEGAVGSTAITPEDYRVKREQAFPAGGQGESVIRLKSANSPAGGQSALPGRWVNKSVDWLWGKVESARDWQVVSQVSAQTCGGDWKCGTNWEECKCGDGSSCAESQDGDLCGSNAGTCNCNTICVQNVGALNSCNVAYGVCGSGISCSQCVALNTCAWSGPTATPGGPTPTSGAGSGDRCVVAGKIEKYDNLNLANASGVVSLWSALGTSTDSTDGSGNFSFDKKYDSVADAIKIYVNNPYGSYRTFKVKGSVPNGCSKTDGDKTIQCPKSVCFNKSSSSYVFNFEEEPPAANVRPNCTMTGGDQTGTVGGAAVTWTTTCTDSNSNLDYAGTVVNIG